MYLMQSLRSAELEKSVTSVQATVAEINGLLASFGFTSSKLAIAGDRNESYAILRSDGTSARHTLSEGEQLSAGAFVPPDLYILSHLDKTNHLAF